MEKNMSKLGNVPHRYARYAEIMFYEDASGWQTFKYGKLGEVTENIRTFALPFENQTYTFKMNFEYDPFNRIQSILYPDSELVEYRYNLGGMLNKVTGSVTRKITDLVVVTPMQNASLLQGGDEIQGGGIAPGTIPDPGPIEIQTVTLRYPYLDSIVYNKFELKDSVVYGNGTRVRYVYDSLQRLTALRSYTADDELMQDIAYHYDSVGNILDIENSASTLGNGLGGAYRQEYTYDGLYRLTRATGWWKCRPDHLTLRDTVDMRYSKNGRIIRKRMSAETLKNMQLNLVRCDRQYQYPSVYSNKVNSVTDAMSGTSHQFEWESGGNLMRHVNPDQHYDRRLWWTEDNRLQFVKDNGSTGAYYQYDAGGDRTYKLLYHKTTGSLNGVQTDYYTLDDATLYVSPYLVVTPQGYTKHYYAESERITTQLGKYRFAVVDSCVAGDSLAPMKLQNAAQAFLMDSFPTPTSLLGYLHSLTNHPNTVSTLNFYHPDHLGSASWITNIYGRTIQHLYYLPWGEDFVNQRTGSFSSMYTFSAKEKDTETGYSYFGARYYSSDLSIWLSVDPMSDKYPSLSPYVYCADNPIKLVDPNGMEIGGHPKRKKHNNTPPFLKYIGFSVRHPSAAINIGKVTHNSSNISTVATRFATRGEILSGSANNQDDRGSQNGAFRHTLWQAAITSMYGESVAKQAGNAHEKNPSVDLSQRYFSNLDEADQVVDLLNNQIGRRIGKQNTGADMNELAQIVLSEFESNGLYTASQMAEGKYVITLNRISESQYIQLKSIFENLNCYGRTPEEQGDIDQQNKEKMERLQQTWGTIK